VIADACAAAGVGRRPITPGEIVDRTMLALVDEAARILDEGCASRASDIDLVYLHGYGFPAGRGGPLCYADSVGLAEVCERLTRYRRARGEPADIAPLLRRLAAAGSSFAAWDAERDNARA
jgi:3-hydroxyacyl-CoA dehydrogenase